VWAGGDAERPGGAGALQARRALGDAGQGDYVLTGQAPAPGTAPTQSKAQSQSVSSPFPAHS
jgi:hypothetical protein